MIGLIEHVAPRSLADGFVKSLAFLILINAMDYLTTGATGSVAVDPLIDAIDTTIIALPFVIMTMVVLYNQRRLQHRLMKLATTDVLTGLLNRRAFMARTLDATLEGRAGALLVLDADHFKRINDTWGHAVGDACLVAIGEHLRAALRPGDVVGRMGGEEFSIFLPGATRAEAAAVGERLCRGVAFEAQGLEEALRVTLSAGATMGGPPTPLSRLLAQADAALYRAKAEGRARLVFWSEDEDLQGSRAA